MGVRLRAGANILELLDRGDQLLSVRDLNEAIRFLERLQLDSAQIAGLRGRVLKSVQSHRGLTDRQVLEALASLIVSGQLRILRRVDRQAAAGGGEAAAPEPQGATQAAPASSAARKKAWIEIKLLDHQGKPVPKQPFRIKFPDGSTDQGRLNDFGEAEYYGINPGTCQICFPELGNDEYEPV